MVDLKGGKMSVKPWEKEIRMFQITEFDSPGKKMNTEYGNITYAEWLEKERKRIGGWTFVVRKEDSKRRIALFYKKDRR